MTLQIALLLTLVVAAAVLFALERFPADVVALGLMLTLVLTGLVAAEDAFRGFGSDTVLMILGLLILNAALLRTGVVDRVGRAILARAGESPMRLLVVIMISASTLGAFMSNTASTAFFLPVVISLARQAKVSPSKFLLPLAFSTILSSSVTLISTSTNVVVSGLMTRSGLEPMGMFELAPVGIPIAVVGLVYMATLGRALLPARTGSAAEGLDEWRLGPYLTEVVVRPGAPLAGKTLDDAALGSKFDLTILRVIREDRKLSAAPHLVLQEGDVLVVEGKADELLEIKDAAGVDVRGEARLADPDVDWKDMGLAEALVMPGSSVIRRTLKQLRFRQRYGIQVVGIHRHGQSLPGKLADEPLRMGDALVLQGRPENIAALADEGAFRLVGRRDEARPVRRHGPLAIVIFVLAIASAALGVIPLPVAVLLGAFFVLATGCITPQEAYREVEWKAIILIGCMLSLGVAMDQTGAADWVAHGIVEASRPLGPYALLTGFFVMTVVLTQPLSNQAAAIVVLPIALAAARQADLSPRTFAMMVAVAASTSYITPLEPSCLMVYGPGGYRFRDFLKVGAILTVLIYLIAIVLVPIVWPLQPAG